MKLLFSLMKFFSSFCESPFSFAMHLFKSFMQMSRCCYVTDFQFRLLSFYVTFLQLLRKCSCYVTLVAK